VWAGLVGSALLAGCGHIGHATRGGDDCPPGGDCPDHTKVCTDPSLMALGHDLDHLERHIDWYGSVVARGPDVWGQARLTEHRQQFEEEMFKDFDDFELNLQGSLARSDQAFFAHATALSFAAQPKPPTIGRSSSVKGEPPAIVPLSADVETVTTQPLFIRQGKDVGSVQTTRTEKLGPVPSPPEPEVIKAKAADDAKSLVDGFSTITRTGARLPGPHGFAGIGKGGITIEPTLKIAQKKRYLDFLNQIRRENEGDDTADSPGYSMNLVRIPVSLLPGKRTDVGHGAEITMTFTPILGDDLLPATFRSLVANDLRHQLGLPLANMLNDDEAAEAFLNDENQQGIRGLPVFNRIANAARHGDQALANTVGLLSAEDRERAKAVAVFLPAGQKEYYLDLLANTKATEDQRALGNEYLRMGQQIQDTKLLTINREAIEYGKWVRTPGRSRNLINESAAGKRVVHLSLKVQTPALAFSPGLINKTGFPTSQLFEVYGLSNCFQIAFTAHAAMHESIARQKYAHLPDVQGFLQQETMAAYRFLAEPNAAQLWRSFCTPEIVTAVRLRQADLLEERRAEFRAIVRELTKGTPLGRADRPHLEPGEYSTTAALAWCILVDSALLTEKLVRDMGETASAKRAAIPHCGAWLDYYHPHPSPEARAAFAEYVKLRWPVRVFALDPSTQDQNLADSLSTRRETQLALAIAFTNGFINANTMTRYARRLEAEYETIAINRPQVGFGHGENVFGWRFYPRFQTPDTEGNLTVLLRDQLIGGPNRNQLLRDRRLEPGPRECVALVMMPSFVPYVTMDTVGNWFGLANPKHKVLDHTQALKLSRTVQTLKTCGPAVKDAACYRDGEFERMLRRVEQLEARLPSQTARFPVPVLNTLGGFEMFSNGTTDLAPELYGWYGAPGVSATKTTTLFLVGDHFSPLHTKVIIGNKEAKASLLSRQVMKVEVNQDVVQLPAARVSAHLATPYGVTRELLIPVVGNPAAGPAPGFTIGDQKLVAKYALTADPFVPPDRNLFLPVALGSGTEKLSIRWVAPGNVLTGQAKVRFEFEYATGDVKVKLQSEVPGTVTKQAVVIGKDDLDRLTCDLIGQIVQVSPRLPREPNPLAAPLVSTKVTITPVPPDGDFVPQSVEANDSLQLEFAPVAPTAVPIPPTRAAIPPAGPAAAGPVVRPPATPLPLASPTPLPLSGPPAAPPAPPVPLPPIGPSPLLPTSPTPALPAPN
jgi:hypothetical protein